jgi:hypothetical protein
MHACAPHAPHFPPTIRLTATFRPTHELKQIEYTNSNSQSILYYSEASQTTFSSEGLERESRIAGHFPPSSRATGVKFFAAAVMTRRPTRGLPKDIYRK